MRADTRPVVGVQVRAATEVDVEQLAAMHVASWRESYRHLLSERFLAEMSVEDRVAVWHQVLQVPEQVTVLAEHDGEVIGFAGARPDAEGPRPLHLWGIYVLGAWQGSGVAQQLLDAAIGDAPCFLWVAADNPRGHAFYLRNGFAPDGAEDTIADWEGMPVVRLVR